MTQMIDATSRPDQVNMLIAEAVADAPAPVTAPAPAVPAQPDTSVELMAGLVDQLQGTTTTNAVVRELTGADEEALTSPAVLKSTVKYLQGITGRGVVSIGDNKPTPQQFSELLIGDRELLLLGIRKATYGPDVEMTTRCPFCDDVDEDYTYSLENVEVRPLRQVEDAVYGFEFAMPSGKTAMVTLPRAADQDALLSSDKKSEGELNTMMLTQCVQKIDGMMVVGSGPLRALSIRDRRALLEEINDRTPGPRLGEAKRTCRACEKEFPLGIGLLDIFRG